MEATTTATADYRNFFDTEDEGEALQLANLNALKEALKAEENTQKTALEETGRCFSVYTAAQTALNVARQAMQQMSPGLPTPSVAVSSSANRFQIWNDPPKAPVNGSAYDYIKRVEAWETV